MTTKNTRIVPSKLCYYTVLAFEVFLTQYPARFCMIWLHWNNSKINFTIGNYVYLFTICVVLLNICFNKILFLVYLSEVVELPLGFTYYKYYQRGHLEHTRHFLKCYTINIMMWLEQRRITGRITMYDETMNVMGFLV